ncbi:LysM peptidoglycan-binding domain-containing protein, partial [Cronobacter sakazakii]
WLLTVAAYNSGEGRVLKAMKANKARGKPTDFWSLSLPQETKIYVPKMLALSDILKNSKRYGVRLPTTDESRALARVKVNNPVEMEQLAEMAGISVNKLKTFNAGVKGSTLGVSGPQYVMVPQKHAQQLRTSLAAGEIAAVQPTMVADNSLSARTYKVRSGDTLSAIAARMNVSTKDLQRWNNLRGAKLKPGQTLSVGTVSGAGELASNNDSITYKVRKGDSLASIAKRHGVNIKDVLRWNSDTDNLQPGDQITLFVKNSSTPDS